MTRVVVFAGGRGATTILTSLARTRNVQLTVVVNAYDAGLSTGRVRRAMPGMLGPSDLRKTAGTLVGAVGTDDERNLASLLEMRLPERYETDTPRDHVAEAQFSAILSGRLDELDGELLLLVKRLSLERWSTLRQHLTAFQKFLASTDKPFVYDDLAIGNVVLAGLFVDSDFNRSVESYQDFLGLSEQRILNVTEGEDLWLTARAGDYVCPDEGTLVSDDPPAPISDLYLLPRAAQHEIFGDLKDWHLSASDAAALEGAEILPLINPRVADAIGHADVIVYGPGTQHSSLFPTYLTIGLGEAVRGNTAAEKIFVANITRDQDQHPAENVADILEKFRYFMSRRDQIELAVGDLITSVLTDPDDAECLRSLDTSIRTRSAVWSDPSGRHSGSAVKEEISSVVRRRSGEHLPGDSGLLSVIVPVLDEAPRIGQVLQQLRYIDLGFDDLVHEIVVVDGGSTDGTLKILRDEPDIRVIEAKCRGRGEAIHLGLAHARGEYVVAFHGDGEYDVASIAEVVFELRKDSQGVVLASRTLGGSSASHRLRAVYGNNRLLYVLSHWGGVLVTLLLMIKLDRIVSDPLSGVRGARRDVFRLLDNHGRSLDYEVTWLKRAVESGHRVTEVSVDYIPRSWRDGKKTSISDGLRALVSVFTRPVRSSQ
jgi:2-phospho-L-lactate transferase/gluconeogenesis factor (CofD/UPF0052 family)